MTKKGAKIDDRLQRLYQAGWEDDQAQTSLSASEDKYASPIAACTISTADKSEAFREFRRRAQRRLDRYNFTEEEVLAAQPSEFKLPASPSGFLGKREAYVWDNSVLQAFNQLSQACEGKLGYELEKLTLRFKEIKRLREELLGMLRSETTARDGADRASQFYRQIRELVPYAQRFDARSVELKARIRVPGDGWGEWADIRSMHRLYQGPAETWIYHLLNLVDAALFESDADGRKMTTVWDQFRNDFLGGGKPATEVTGCWAADDPASRIRFVSVAESDDDTEDGGNAAAPAEADRIIGEDGTVHAQAFDYNDYSREFIMLGLVDDAGDRTIPFSGVEWQMLITCDIAPPYSTCRLNFFSKSHGQAWLDKHTDLVTRLWQHGGATAEMISKIQKVQAEVIAARGD